MNQNSWGRQLTQMPLGYRVCAKWFCGSERSLLFIYFQTEPFCTALANPKLSSFFWGLTYWYGITGMNGKEHGELST